MDEPARPSSAVELGAGADTAPAPVAVTVPEEKATTAFEGTISPSEPAKEEPEFEEFVNSFHYATLVHVTDALSLKSCIYLIMSCLLLIFQIVALLGFQMRGAYVFCQSDNDCTIAGQYCETSIGVCKGIDSFRQCFEASDCETPTTKNFVCSTSLNHTCAPVQTKCTAHTDCPYSMFCNTDSGQCTNDYVEWSKQNNIRDQVTATMLYAGYRNCTSTSECYQETEFNNYLTSHDNVTDLYNYFSCFYSWSLDYTTYSSKCMARIDEKYCQSDVDCPVWQTCNSASQYCVDMLGVKCNKNADCVNSKSSQNTTRSEVNYYCPWNLTTSQHGICYYAGQICNSDSDCKIPGWQCNATVTSIYNGNYGYCFDPNAGQTQSTCQDPSLLQLDVGTLVFVCIVICINVAKDLREAIITEMKLRSKYSEVAANKIVSWRQLFGQIPKPPMNLKRTWGMFLCIIILECALFVRKYMFIPLVLAVTSTAMSGQNANGIIMNGVAIFFVVDIDNLFFDFFHSKWQVDYFEENEKLAMSGRQARYLHLISLFGAISMIYALLLVVRRPSKVIGAFSKCTESNSSFVVGGAFMIICLFVGYFIAALLVPILEMLWPTDKEKQEKMAGKSFKMRISEQFQMVDLRSNAAWNSRLTIWSQLMSVFWIVAQGVIGAFLFLAIVESWHSTFVGAKEKKYNPKDDYAELGAAAVSMVRSAYLAQAKYW